MDAKNMNHKGLGGTLVLRPLKKTYLYVSSLSSLLLVNSVNNVKPLNIYNHKL